MPAAVPNVPPVYCHVVFSANVNALHEMFMHRFTLYSAAAALSYLAWIARAAR